MTIADDTTAPGDSGAASSDNRLILVPVGTEDWLIHDTRFPDNDARRLVACVRERGSDHVDVIWLRGKGLPSRFARVQDAMEAAGRAVAAGNASTSARARRWRG
jgi:hypothetical protein